MTPAPPFPALTGLGARRLVASQDRVVVVGAGGWLGLATLEALHQTLGDAFHDRVVCYGSNRRTLGLRAGLEVAQSPLSELSALERAPSLVLHFAFLTQEKAKAMGEEAYVAANRAISGQVLDALDPIGAQAVFVASSGAVHMAGDPGADPSKRLYGELKLADETAFSQWAEDAGRRAVIARVFNVAGPYMTVGGAYALAAFIADALAGRPISIKARRPVWRSYVAINEMMSVAFGLLTDGTADAEIFETAGPEPQEMGAVAQAVAHTLNPSLSMERSAPDDTSEDRYVADGLGYQALRRRLEVEPVDFAEQIRETARFMALAAASR